MSISSGDVLWSTPLQHRVQSYQSQIHSRSTRNDPVGDSALLSDIMNTFEALNTFTAELKMCINAMSIASRLSPEILALTFHFLSHDLPVASRPTPYCIGYEDLEETNVLSSWVKVTHVSKHWREVALGDTSLWNEVSTAHGPSWAQAMLDRSGLRNVHLRLGVCMSDDFDNLIWEQAISRAHTIQIGYDRVGWEDRILRINVSSLTAFRVCLDCEEIGEVCPKRFFESTSSEFRELELCGYGFYEPRSIMLYPALTNLKLGLLSEDTWANVSLIKPMLDALSQLQQLRALTLLGLIALGEPDADGSVDTQYAYSVRLPHLQLLHLENCCSPVLLALFNAIAIPPHAKLRLITRSADWEEEGHVDQMREFGHILQRRLSATPWHSLQTVAMFPGQHTPNFMQLANPISDEYESFAVAAWRAEIDAHDVFCDGNGGPAPKDEHEPDFYLCMPREYEALDDYLDTFLRIFCQPSVHTLFLTLDLGLSVQQPAWGKRLAYFPALHHIHR